MGTLKKRKAYKSKTMMIWKLKKMEYIFVLLSMIQMMDFSLKRFCAMIKCKIWFIYMKQALIMCYRMEQQLLRFSIWSASNLMQFSLISSQSILADTDFDAFLIDSDDDEINESVGDASRPFDLNNFFVSGLFTFGICELSFIFCVFVSFVFFRRKKKKKKKKKKK